MGVDLDAPGIQEKLKALSEGEKGRLKKLLLEVKEVSQEQAGFTMKLPLLEKIAINEHLEDCRITVKQHLIPQVVVRIGNDTRLEQQKQNSVVYRYVYNQGIEVKKK
jgi:hypothetical protein